MSKEDYIIDEVLNSNNDYIKIYEDDEMIFEVADGCCSFNACEDDISNICRLLNDLADNKEIDEEYRVERTSKFYEPEVLREFAEFIKW